VNGAYDVLYGAQLAFRVRGKDASMRRWRRCIAEPDDNRRILLEIQYEKHIPIPDGSSRVGRTAGWTTDGFCVSEGFGWAVIPMGQLLSESPFIIRGQEHFDPLRLLGYIIEPIVMIRSLLYGFLFMHSSAVVIDGEALVFPAWENTGKTSLVLSMAHGGATILSDDRCVLCPERKAAGVPRPLNLLNYNFRVFPEYKHSVKPMKKVALAGDSLLFHFNKRFGQNMQGLPMRVLGVALKASAILATTKVPLPEDFPVGMDLPVRAIVALGKHSGQGYKDALQPITRESLLSQLTSCFMFENIRLLRRIWEWEFLCPEGTDGMIESIRQLHEAVAKARLAEFVDDNLMQFSLSESCSRAEWHHIGRQIRTRFCKR